MRKVIPNARDDDLSSFLNSMVIGRGEETGRVAPIARLNPSRNYCSKASLLETYRNHVFWSQG